MSDIFNDEYERFEKTHKGNFRVNFMSPKDAMK